MIKDHYADIWMWWLCYQLRVFVDLLIANWLWRRSEIRAPYRMTMNQMITNTLLDMLDTFPLTGLLVWHCTFNSSSPCIPYFVCTFWCNETAPDPKIISYPAKHFPTDPLDDAQSRTPRIYFTIFLEERGQDKLPTNHWADWKRHMLCILIQSVGRRSASARRAIFPAETKP